MKASQVTETQPQIDTMQVKVIMDLLITNWIIMCIVGGKGVYPPVVETIPTAACIGVICTLYQMHSVSGHHCWLTHAMVRQMHIVDHVTFNKACVCTLRHDIINQWKCEQLKLIDKNNEISQATETQQ